MGAILDHTGQPFRPSPNGNRRLSRQSVHANYDAAETTDDNRNHWAMANGLSANATNNPERRRILRNRARYETANNSYARGIVLTLANDLVGNGPRLQLLTPNSDANRELERHFMRWSKAVCLADKLRTMRLARATDGEAFAMLAVNSQLSTVVQLDLRLIEADQVTSPTLSWDPHNIDGVIIDDAGNPVEYQVLKQHPGDLLVNGFAEYDSVSAGQMLHWFRCDRPGQARGIPDISPALPLFAQLRRYTLAVIAAAETAADFALMLESGLGPNDQVDELAPMLTMPIEQRMMTALPRGHKATQLRAEQPTTTYGEFKREILNEITRCLNMPANVARGDSSGYNYASGRLDHQTYFKSIRVEQSQLECVVLDRILTAWLDEAVMVPGLIPADLPPIYAWDHQWFWDGHEHVDPAKEANAQSTRLASHTTTLAEEYARRGLDWEEQLRQRAKELELMQQLGITLSASPSTNANDIEDDDLEEEEEEEKANARR